MKYLLSVLIAVLIFTTASTIHLLNQKDDTNYQIHQITVKVVKNEAVAPIEPIKPVLEPVVLPETGDFIETYKPDNPLIEYKHIFYDHGMKGKLALAIAANESHLGTYKPASDNYNAWGYLCYRPNQSLDCGWDSWDYSIPRYLELADHYLSMFDGSKESLMALQDAGYHPVGDEVQSVWADNILWFYNQL